MRDRAAGARAEVDDFPAAVVVFGAFGAFDYAKDI
jgi:hypothetical protein